MDDLKVFAASESKLNTVLRATSDAMQDIGLHWNPKKCSVIHIRKGKQIENAADLKLDESTPVQSLKTGSSYKFLGVSEGDLARREASNCSCSKGILTEALSDLDKPST